MPSSSPPLRLFGLLLFAAATQAAANNCPEPEQLTDRDRKQILLLAKRMGMQGPLRLCWTWWGQPSGCPAMLAESMPVVTGNQRSWQRLYLGRVTQDPKLQCPWGPEGSEPLREGGWVADKSNLNTDTLWRFTHDEHQVDIRLGQQVAYEQAHLIIKSLRERSWRDELKPDGRRFAEHLLVPGNDLADRVSGIFASHGKQHGFEVWITVRPLTQLLLEVDLDGQVLRVLSVHLVMV